MSRAEPIVRRWLRPALWMLVIVPLLWIVARGALGKLGANPIRTVEDLTGQWALRLLAASLAVTPMITLTRWGWLIRERRFLGLAAFYGVVLHLSIYIGLDNFFDVSDIVKDVLKHLYITVGMAAFLMLVPLAVTSTKGWIKRLGGRRWNALHRLVYPAAVAGCVHFLWSVKKDITEPLIYSAVFAVLFALRLIKRERRASSVTVSPGTAST
jgi:sulfoxide reductase heme-binding subunit YedZ